jgi:beta-glucosidase
LPQTISDSKWESGDVAYDHYQRYKEDVGLMQAIGLQAYRLSISWSHVLPQGTGISNSKGLEFYDCLVDELLAADITPYVTLYHWDLPYELHCRGGWLNPQSPDWFAEFATLMAEGLSDRVNYWMTIKEPQVFIEAGYVNGAYASGEKLDWGGVLRVAHQVLLAHGKGVQAVRAPQRDLFKSDLHLRGWLGCPSVNHRRKSKRHDKAPFVSATAKSCVPISRFICDARPRR